MSSRLYTITIDCSDPHTLGRWWAEVLDYEESDESEDEYVIEPRTGDGNELLFIKVPDAKGGKNRIHFDLAPDDQAAEIERLEKMGARRVDIGQKNVTWVVMADPEGNEFCVLTPRPD